MTDVIEKINTISNVMSDLMTFITEDESVKSDFEDYLATIGMKNAPLSQIQAESIPYIFERNLNFKSIPELFLEKKTDLKDSASNIVKSLINSTSSIFEIKKVLKNGFELYNLLNEKDYTVISLSKMSHFRGLGKGQFVVARIIEHESEYYLIEISNVLASNQKDDAMRYAIAKLIQSPELVYKDSPEKLKKIEEQVENLYNKFMECFGTDEVITTNKLADDLIGMFNDYVENNKKPSDIESKIQPLDKYKYTEIKEFNNSYENFLENSMGGFSSHSATYDVGVVYDRELGLSAIPFYKTFCEIFASDDYKSIEGYEKCVEHFLVTDGISANTIKRVNDKYPSFMNVVNEIYSTEMSIDELLQKYKPQYLKQKIFSSTTVLYESKIFDRTLNLFEEEEAKPDIDTTNVGRNDPCPCGSGKKFKKCCGASL